MSVLQSQYRELCPVTLPYDDRQLYMHTFMAQVPGVLRGYGDYLPIVTSLCRAVGATGVAHMTVDEKWVPEGWSQRRRTLRHSS